MKYSKPSIVEFYQIAKVVTFGLFRGSDRRGAGSTQKQWGTR